MLKADLVMNKDDIEERMDTRLNRIEDMMLKQNDVILSLIHI